MLGQTLTETLACFFFNYFFLIWQGFEFWEKNVWKEKYIYIDVQTVRPIITKLDIDLDGHLGGNMGKVLSA